MDGAGRKPIELVINLNDGIKYFRSRVLEAWPDLSKDFNLTIAGRKISLPDGSTMADLGHVVSRGCRFAAIVSPQLDGLPERSYLDGLPEPTSEVTIKSLSGQSVSVTMHPDYTFGTLKRIYAEKQGIPMEQLR